MRSESLEDRIGHRQLAEIAEVDRIGSVQGFVLFGREFFVGLQDAAFDSHGALHVDRMLAFLLGDGQRIITHLL